MTIVSTITTVEPTAQPGFPELAVSPQPAIRRSPIAQTARPPKTDYIDVLRVLAALLVVVFHVAERVIVGLDPTGTAGWWVANLLQAPAHAAVPLFVMISGSLLLAPGRDESAGSFLRRRADRILVPILFWTACYTALWAMAARLGLSDFGHPFTTRNFLAAMAEGTPWYHLWFLYMIPGLYLFTPALRVFVRHADAGLQWYTAGAIFAIAGVYLTLSILLLGPHQVAWVAFVPYLAYFLAGYRLHCDRPWRKSGGVLLAVIVGTIVATGCGTAWLVSRSGEEVWRYVGFHNLGPLSITMSVAIFIFVAGQQLNDGWIVRLCRRLAPATFGVYLIHPLVMSLCRRTLWLNGSSGGAWIGILATALVVYAVSHLFVSIILKIPYLRRVC